MSSWARYSKDVSWVKHSLTLRNIFLAPKNLFPVHRVHKKRRLKIALTTWVPAPPTKTSSLVPYQRLAHQCLVTTMKSKSAAVQKEAIAVATIMDTRSSRRPVSSRPCLRRGARYRSSNKTTTWSVSPIEIKIYSSCPSQSEAVVAFSTRTSSFSPNLHTSKQTAWWSSSPKMLTTSRGA